MLFLRAWQGKDSLPARSLEGKDALIFFLHSTIRVTLNTKKSSSQMRYYRAFASKRAGTESEQA